MNRPAPSSQLNLSRNILLVIGLFNICFYGFVLKSIETSLPKVREEQNKLVEEGKRLKTEDLQAQTAEEIALRKKNYWASIAGGVVIVILAFLIPLAPGLMTILSLAVFSATLIYQFFLSSKLLLEGPVVKVACVFGFFQAVRFAVKEELANITDPPLPNPPPSSGLNFPKPDESQE